MAVMPCGGCEKFKKGDLYSTDQCRFCWLRHHNPVYAEHYRDAEKLVKPRAKEAQETTSGPGTELKKLLKELGYESNPGCACNSRARMMDLWGVKGCRENYQEILAWLRVEYKAKSWGSRLRAAAKALTSGLAFSLDPLHPVESLLDEAIRRAEAAGSTPTP